MDKNKTNATSFHTKETDVVDSTKSTAFPTNQFIDKKHEQDLKRLLRSGQTGVYFMLSSPK